MRPLLYLLLLYLSQALAQTPPVFHYRGPESLEDKRHEYNLSLLRLALDKTRARYGDYRLQAIPPMNIARSIQALRKNEYANLLIELSYEDNLLLDGRLDFVPFPIDLGVVGYRICFVAPDLAPPLKPPVTLDQLRRYQIGQGLGWADSKILRHNGFTVVEVGQYESLFKMVAAGRFDLFCRGINELFIERQAHADLPGLTVETGFALHYPLPRFFFLHQGNPATRQRILEGLQAAYADGSLQALWQQEYGDSIKAARLQSRQIFELSNPLLQGLPPTYQTYWFSALPREGAAAPALLQKPE